MRLYVFAFLMNKVQKDEKQQNWIYVYKDDFGLFLVIWILKDFSIRDFVLFAKYNISEAKEYGY